MMTHEEINELIGQMEDARHQLEATMQELRRSMEAYAAGWPE